MADPLKLVVTGATVYDGTGAAPASADVGIGPGGRIAGVGKLEPSAASRVLDASGLACAPGFIDVHNHSDEGDRILLAPLAENLVRQGITTIVCGNCGSSRHPIGAHLDAVAEAGVSLNYSILLGLGTLRGAGGDAAELLAEALDEGAVGLSSADPSESGAELDRLLEVLVGRGRVYSPHSLARDDAPWDEMAAVADACRRTGVRAHVSHVAARDARFWGGAGKVLAVVDAAAAEGLALDFNVYPYDSGSAGLWGMFVPGPFHSDPEIGRKIKEHAPDLERALAEKLKNVGGAERVRYAGADEELRLKTLDEISRAAGRDPVALLIEWMETNPGVVVHSESEEDLRELIRHPLCTVITDGYARAHGDPVGHPHDFGTFPRVLGRFARDEGLFALEDIIRRMTSLPAGTFGLEGRGTIAAGSCADLVLFDPAKVAEAATYENPGVFPAGIEHVLVNGELVVESGRHTGLRPGTVLRGE